MCGIRQHHLYAPTDAVDSGKWWASTHFRQQSFARAWTQRVIEDDRARGLRHRHAPGCRKLGKTSLTMSRTHTVGCVRELQQFEVIELALIQIEGGLNKIVVRRSHPFVVSGANLDRH